MTKSSKQADARSDEALRDLISNWPPLSREQKDKLRILLKPAPRTGQERTSEIVKDEWDV